MDEDKLKKLEELPDAEADDGHEIMPPNTLGRGIRYRDMPPTPTDVSARPNAVEQFTASKKSSSKDWGKLESSKAATSRIEVERMIDAVDVNHDGVFTRDEVVHLVLKNQQLASTMQTMTRVGWVLAALAFVGLIIPMAYFGYSWAKDFEPDNDGVLRTKQNTNVRVHSADLKVSSDNALVSASSNAPVSTGRKFIEYKLTSRVPDKYLRELNSFTYEGADSQLVEVLVEGFTRVPSLKALCGSVVVLETSMGSFTLDDEQIFHAKMNIWLDTVGQFRTDDRRRLGATAEGRRRLEVSTANGLFHYLEGQQSEFECHREFLNESYQVEPRSPKKPYSYTALSIISCWEPDETSRQLNFNRENDEHTYNRTQRSGSTRRCTSLYGPNAGKDKPGVATDRRFTNLLNENEKVMVSPQYALMTENYSIVVHRHPNHPLQLHIHIEDQRPDVHGNLTAVSFQLLDDDLSNRHHCAIRSYKDPGNILFESNRTHLALLGINDGLRHWRVSRIHDDGNNGTILNTLADYFDGSAPGNPPHSVHINRNTREASELRYTNFRESLTESEVEEWLNDLFPDKTMYDISNTRQCTEGDRVDGIPTGMEPFAESQDNVDWYTKAMLEHYMEPAWVDSLEATSLSQYWGAAMYLRRLLAEQFSDDDSKSDISDITSAQNHFDVKVAQTSDFTNPFFFRELGTKLDYGARTTDAEVLSMWRRLSTSQGFADSELYLASVALESGLTLKQLKTVPAPIDYNSAAVLSTVAGNSFTVPISRDLVPDTICDGTNLCTETGHTFTPARCCRVVNSSDPSSAIECNENTAGVLACESTGFVFTSNSSCIGGGDNSSKIACEHTGFTFEGATCFSTAMNSTVPGVDDKEQCEFFPHARSFVVFEMFCTGTDNQVFRLVSAEHAADDTTTSIEITDLGQSASGSATLNDMADDTIIDIATLFSNLTIADTRVFFFSDYSRAASTKCDPGLSMWEFLNPNSTGDSPRRRMQAGMVRKPADVGSVGSIVKKNIVPLDFSMESFLGGEYFLGHGKLSDHRNHVLQEIISQSESGRRQLRTSLRTAGHAAIAVRPGKDARPGSGREEEDPEEEEEEEECSDDAINECVEECVRLGDSDCAERCVMDCYKTLDCAINGECDIEAPCSEEPCEIPGIPMTFESSYCPMSVEAFKFIGCYNDRGDPRDMGDGSWHTLYGPAQDRLMQCAEKCNGFAYMGLQADSACFCDNDYGTYGQAHNLGMCDSDGFVGTYPDYADRAGTGIDPPAYAVNAVYEIRYHWSSMLPFGIRPLCKSVWTMDLTAARPISTLARNIGVAVEGSFGYEMLPIGDPMWRMPIVDNKCKQGISEFLDITVTKDGMPRFIKRLGLDKYYSQEATGWFRFTHAHCIKPHEGHSMAAAEKEQNLVKVEAEASFAAALRFCQGLGLWGADARAELLLALGGFAKIYYKDLSRSYGEVYGVMRAGISADAYIGNCGCECNDDNEDCSMSSRVGWDFWNNCYHIIGFTGEISVTIEFKDIRFGGDGVDIHISLAAFMEARIFGARIQILTIDAGPMVIRNVVQLPSLGQSFEEGATEAKAEDETVPDCVNVRVGSHRHRNEPWHAFTIPQPVRAWRYVGCYADGESRDLPDKHIAISGSSMQRAQQCMENCAGWQFFGLQWSNQCFCGNSFGSAGVRPETYCDSDSAVGDYPDLADNAGVSSSNPHGWTNAVYEILYADYQCPEIVDRQRHRDNVNDAFSLTQTQRLGHWTSELSNYPKRPGTELTIHRIDTGRWDESWGMDLRFQCCRGDMVEYAPAPLPRVCKTYSAANPSRRYYDILGETQYHYYYSKVIEVDLGYECPPVINRNVKEWVGQPNNDQFSTISSLEGAHESNNDHNENSGAYLNTNGKYRVEVVRTDSAGNSWCGTRFA